MSTLTPTTELEAVNMMLAAIGEAPASTLEVAGLGDVAVARMLLHVTNRACQLKRLHCNTEYEVVLTPEVGTGKIPIASNVLFIDPSRGESKDLTQRGSYLYNLDDHTDVFTDTVKCDVTYFLSFESLPEHVRWYITLVAARRFQDRFLGSQAVHMFTQQDETDALAEFSSKELSSEDANILHTDTANQVLRRSM